jgi:hypothetical protein
VVYLQSLVPLIIYANRLILNGLDRNIVHSKGLAAFVKTSFHWSSRHSTGKLEALDKGATPAMNAWIWTYATIMREEGRVICKSGEEFFASVFSGLGRSAPGRALDIESDGA